MVTLLLPGVPLAFHSLPITLSLFLVQASLSYLEIPSVNKGNQDSHWMVCLSDKVCFLFYPERGQIGNTQRSQTTQGWVVGASSGSLGWEGQGMVGSKGPFSQPRPFPVGAGLCPEGGKPGCVGKYRSWCKHCSQCFVFIRTSSVFSSMKTFRKQYENSIKWQNFLLCGN